MARESGSCGPELARRSVSLGSTLWRPQRSPIPIRPSRLREQRRGDGLALSAPVNLAAPVRGEPTGSGAATPPTRRPLALPPRPLPAPLQVPSRMAWPAPPSELSNQQSPLQPPAPESDELAAAAPAPCLAPEPPIAAGCETPKRSNSQGERASSVDGERKRLGFGETPMRKMPTLTPVKAEADGTKTPARIQGGRSTRSLSPTAWPVAPLGPRNAGGRSAPGPTAASSAPQHCIQDSDAAAASADRAAAASQSPPSTAAAAAAADTLAPAAVRRGAKSSSRPPATKVAAPHAVVSTVGAAATASAAAAAAVTAASTMASAQGPPPSSAGRATPATVAAGSVPQGQDAARSRGRRTGSWRSRRSSPEPRDPRCPSNALAVAVGPSPLRASLGAMSLRSPGAQRPSTPTWQGSPRMSLSPDTHCFGKEAPKEASKGSLSSARPSSRGSRSPVPMARRRMVYGGA